MSSSLPHGERDPRWSGLPDPGDDPLADGLPTLDRPQEDDADEDTDAAPGRGGRLVAGRYAVHHTIATGGMGEVLLARHVGLGRLVALKVMKPPRGEERINFPERFRTEARTLAAFDHPHIVTVHDFGVLDDGRCFLAMEYVEGPQLAALLKDGPLPATRALTLGLQVCRALQYAHERGVVHRDLTPSNLLLTEGPGGGPRVKLVDFGIAKVTHADAEETQNGVILGSPHVMAPEQIDGQRVDPRTDVYQVGVLLFRMITGAYPFRGRHTMAILMAHLEQPVPRFADVAPDVPVPEGLEDVVRRCLAKDGADRFPDMDALIQALTSVLRLPPGGLRLQGGGRPGAAAPAVGPPPRALRLLLVAALVGALGLLVGGLWMGLALGRSEAPAPTAAEVALEVVGPPMPTAPPAEPAAAEPSPEAAPRSRARPARPTRTPAPEAVEPPPTPSRPVPEGYEALPDF